MPLSGPGIVSLGRHKPGLTVFKTGTVAFTPSSITGLYRWYKADAGTSTTTDGVAISQWNDQSTSAVNLTQATGSVQPLYKTAIQNGKPGVKFDGVDDNLRDTAFSLAQPDTIFVVAKALTTDASIHRLFDGVTRQLIQMDGATLWGYFAGSSVAGTAANTSAHVFSAVFNGASSGLWLDGASIAAGNPGANSLINITVGASGSGASVWPGYIFEFLAYSGALSTANRQAVESYLKSRWATP